MFVQCPMQRVSLGAEKFKYLLAKQASASEFITATSNCSHSIPANKTIYCPFSHFLRKRFWTSFQIPLIFFSLSYWYQYVMLQKNSSCFSWLSYQELQSQNESFIFRMPLFGPSHSDKGLLILIWLKLNGRIFFEFSDSRLSLNHSLRMPPLTQYSYTWEVSLSSEN